jgi:hypothetical protein
VKVLNGRVIHVRMDMRLASTLPMDVVGHSESHSAQTTSTEDDGVRSFLGWYGGSVDVTSLCQGPDMSPAARDLRYVRE